MRVSRFAAVVSGPLLTMALTCATVGGAGAAPSTIPPTAVLLHPDEVYAGTVSAGPPTTAQCEADFKVACYQPAQIEQAYDLPTLFSNGITGKGETIVIVDSYGSPTIGHDLAVFDTDVRAPRPAVAHRDPARRARAALRGRQHPRGLGR